VHHVLAQVNSDPVQVDRFIIIHMLCLISASACIYADVCNMFRLYTLVGSHLRIREQEVVDVCDL
jgi:hypothetical protein